MKNKRHRRLIIFTLISAMLFPTIVSAALPCSAAIQWTNTQVVTCDLIMSDNLGSVCATVIGDPSSVVQATATLTSLKGIVKTIVYTESTPEDYSLYFADFLYEFVPQSYTTYRLDLDAVVSLNGVDEVIDEHDIVLYS